MTNQQKKDVLQQYRAAAAEADRLSREIREWRRKSRQLVSETRDCAEHGRVAEAVTAMDDLAQLLVEKRLESVQLRRQLERKISAVPDRRLQELLRRRYIDGDTWEQIAVAMGMSYQWTCHLHGVALGALDVESLDRS